MDRWCETTLEVDTQVSLLQISTFFKCSNEVIMEFNDFTTKMYTENCVERRQHGEDQYKTVSEYVANGTNMVFLKQKYQEYLDNPTDFFYKIQK